MFFKVIFFLHFTHEFFPPGLRPVPRWGAYSAPQTPSWSARHLRWLRHSHIQNLTLISDHNLAALDFALYVISQLPLSNVSGLRHLVNTPITTSSDADSHRIVWWCWSTTGILAPAKRLDKLFVHGQLIWLWLHDMVKAHISWWKSVQKSLIDQKHTQRQKRCQLQMALFV